jgi:hypothetical protein
MWDFISYKTSTKEEDTISYHKCLKSLYYLNKWVLDMNNYSFLSKCSVEPLEIKSVTKLAPGKNS